MPTNPLTASLQNVSEPTRIETEKYVFHLVPRISATKLAEYVVADPSRKETIVKQAKCASKAIILHYRPRSQRFP
jgi:hypothetical protein